MPTLKSNWTLPKSKDEPCTTCGGVVKPYAHLIGEWSLLFDCDEGCYREDHEDFIDWPFGDGLKATPEDMRRVGFEVEIF